MKTFINIKKLFTDIAAFCVIFLIAIPVLLYGQGVSVASGKPGSGSSAAAKVSVASGKLSSNVNRYPGFLTKNPFESFLYKQKHKISFKVGELPLMQYNLASLHITGIMSRRGHYYAMVQTPDGRAYIVTVGSIMGISRARVVSIAENSILLTEKTFNALGEMRTIHVVMKME